MEQLSNGYLHEELGIGEAVMYDIYYRERTHK